VICYFSITFAKPCAGQGEACDGVLLELISQLQEKATMPMVDVRAYAKWLDV
jgi:hypothetical protein